MRSNRPSDEQTAVPGGGPILRKLFRHSRERRRMPDHLDNGKEIPHWIRKFTYVLQYTMTDEGYLLLSDTLLGAIFVYQPALLYRFEHNIEL